MLWELFALHMQIQKFCGFCQITVGNVILSAEVKFRQKFERAERQDIKWTNGGECRARTDDRFHSYLPVYFSPFTFHPLPLIEEK